MDAFFEDKNIWIVGSVCLVATLLWHRFWNLLRYDGRGESGAPAGVQSGDQKVKDGKEKPSLGPKGLKSQKKKKPPDAAEKQALLPEEVDKRNKHNAVLSKRLSTHTDQESDDAGQVEDQIVLRVCLETEKEKNAFENEVQDEDEVTSTESESEEKLDVSELLQEGTDDKSSSNEPSFGNSFKQSDESLDEPASHSKRRVSGDVPVKEDHKKSRVEVTADSVEETETNGERKKEQEDSKDLVREYLIDCSPPPPAPFDHQIVSTRTSQVAAFYTINWDEMLGGGRFGQVHKCVENSSGLTLAAKIIKARSPKEKEVVKNEIHVMNQLNHANLIQLYAAYESRNDVILVMEYVDGGELFDRIIDENYNLTELDTVIFIRQISEGLQYMHQMYILHLDLKPENILCVSRATNKIKIIDFGLARRYKPREKLRVNFGTPEFLAPEVINYEFVSFPTDMWSLGVITYMLLSGLSPFLGEDDSETLNNILACQWSFEESEFSDISEEAKDFISKLLVKSKSWRMSAAEALKHPWLSNRSLHYQLHEKKNKCRSPHTHNPSS